MAVLLVTIKNFFCNYQDCLFWWPLQLRYPSGVTLAMAMENASKLGKASKEIDEV